MCTKNKIEEKIKKALNEFCSNDRDKLLLEYGANERSITHRFAVCLAGQFPEYDIDCEYNRMLIDETDFSEFLKKQICLSFKKVESSDDKGITVYPDIIIHKRDSKESNLLVIECKTTKNSTFSAKDYDYKKLNAYMNDPNLGYSFSAFIEFPVGGSSKTKFSFGVKEKEEEWC